MLRLAVLVLVLLGAAQVVSPLPAQAAASGLNLSWSADGACVSPPIANRDFACDTNGATFIAVASFTPDHAVPQFYRMEAVIGCQSDGPLPDWWQASYPGSCRETSVSTRTSSVAAGGCWSLWPESPALVGLFWWTALYPPPTGTPPGPNRLLIKVGYQMATARLNLNVLREYNAFQLVLDSNHSVAEPGGGGAVCAGCEAGVSLMLDEIKAIGDAALDIIDSPKTSNCITWQSSTAGCWHPVPVRNTTWGAIKSFYR